MFSMHYVKMPQPQHNQCKKATAFPPKSGTRKEHLFSAPVILRILEGLFPKTKKCKTSTSERKKSKCWHDQLQKM